MSELSTIVVSVVVAVFFGGLLIYIWCAIFKDRSGKTTTNGADIVDEQTVNGRTDKTAHKTSPKQSKGGKGDHARKELTKNAASGPKYTHPLLVTTLKGHTADVCDGDFSASGKYLVTSAEDRSVHIWSCSDFLTDEPAKEIRNNRLNLDFDHASIIRFSPDSKALLGKMNNANVVRVFKLNRKPDGHWSAPQPLHDISPGRNGDILFMEIQCSGKFIMTAHENTNICLWPIKGGEALTVLPTNVGTLHDAKISPCGRFVAASGFTPEVRVFGVVTDKTTGDFQSLEKAFELTGHSAAVPAFAFSGDSTHMVSVSKDKTFRLFDVNVDWKKKQSPRLVHSAPWTKEDVDAHHTQVVLSNDSRCIVIASKADIFVLSGLEGQLKCRINNGLSPIAEGVSPFIQRLLFDPSSGYIIAMGGKIIRVFRNLPGYQIAMEALKESIKFASQDSIRARIQLQLDSAQSALGKKHYPSYKES